MTLRVALCALLLTACGQEGLVNGPDAVEEPHEISVSAADYQFARSFETTGAVLSKRDELVAEILSIHPELEEDQAAMAAIRGEGGMMVTAVPAEYSKVVRLLGMVRALNSRQLEIEAGFDPRVADSDEDPEVRR